MHQVPIQQQQHQQQHQQQQQQHMQPPQVPVQSGHHHDHSQPILSAANIVNEKAYVLES